MKDMDNARVLGENLKKFAAASGKKRKDIAAALVVTPATLSYWMSGKKYPRIDKIEELARYFHIEKSALIEDQARVKDVNPQTTEARMISVGVDKMTPENRKKALELMTMMFAEFAPYFNDGSDDDNEP